MKREICILSLALGAPLALAEALPAAAQLHAAAQANPPSTLKINPATPEPTLPDAAMVVSKADATKFVAAEFAFADADKNLKVTKAEFAAVDKARREKANEKIATPAGVTPPTPVASPPAAVEAPGKPADAQFTEIAGEAAEFDQKALLSARLAAFAKADADANGLLSAGESSKFAAVIAGKSAT
ncbi:MAG: hypothetical protein ABL957_05485 [Parvularculaceae bacterium]